MANSCSPATTAMRHGSPGFLFSYVDGVSIDWGQEGRIQVHNIVVVAPRSRSVESHSRSSRQCVFVLSCRGLEERAGKSVVTKLGGRVLRAWEHLRGSLRESEVYHHSMDVSVRLKVCKFLVLIEASYLESSSQAFIPS